jgi:hypothetical protein
MGAELISSETDVTRVKIRNQKHGSEKIRTGEEHAFILSWKSLTFPAARHTTSGAAIFLAAIVAVLQFW